jgi:beta-glucanase (GH16 family)
VADNDAEIQQQRRRERQHFLLGSNPRARLLRAPPSTTAAMNRRRLLRLLASTALTSADAGNALPLLGARAVEAADPASGPVVFFDDFDSFDPAKWRIAPDGWTDRYGDIVGWDPELVSVADSKLRLSVLQRDGRWYGALVYSRNPAAWTYGYFEVRAKLPAGQGLWSALWMMPVESTYGYWPRSGEIDLLEYIGTAAEIGSGYSTLHFAADAGGAPGKVVRMASGDDWSQDWHTWGCLWRKLPGGRVVFRFSVDGAQYGEIEEAQWPAASGGAPGSPFDRPFRLLFNVTVGGEWAGRPAAASSGKVLEVDWVRIYGS